jgi:EmrB/QacA subfamily drug resistance transporter
VLVGGALGDRLGRKRVFSAGVVLFAVASAACGSAPGAHVLVAARAVQGIGAALLVPGSLALISAAYPQAERGEAIGIWSMLTSITAAVAPIAGGVVVSRTSWRWVFLFNVPVAIGVLALGHKGVDDARDASASRRMDWPGAGLVTLGLGAMVYALIDDGATVGVVGEATLLTAGAAVLVGFVVFESRAAAPMVPLSLFRSRTFAGTNLLTLLLYGALGGALFFLPFNLIQAQGYDPAAAGAALLPFVVAISFLSPAMGALSHRFGARPLLVAGSLASAAGYVLLALPARGGLYWATYFPGIAVLGIGMGIAVAPLTTAVMTSVEDHQAGVASGVNNAVARAGGLVAVAALGVVLRVRFDRVLDERLAVLRLSAAASARIVSEREKLGAADLTALDATAREAARAAFGDAYVAGFRTLMLSSALLAALGALAAWTSVDRAGAGRATR